MENIIKLNRENTNVALKDYVRHTYEHGIIDSISPHFVDRLAWENAHAKRELRELFRKCAGWDENLQAVVINRKVTHNPRPDEVINLSYQIFGDYINQIGRDSLAFWNLRRAFYFFTVDEKDESFPDYLQALECFAPNAYKKGRKKSRIYRDLLKACGINPEANSEIQQMVTQLADEMYGKTVDDPIFISINPAHFLTMSNPICDTRGKIWTSCHTLNNPQYDYSCGNASYAIDPVTFILFTASNPKTLNNRKTSRQLHMHKVGGDVIVHSRLYDCNGGVRGKSETANNYRDIVQRVIAESEGVTNLWMTANYYQNKWCVRCDAHEDFGGYADWIEFTDDTIKISVRKGAKDPKGFIIGNYGICVECGNATFGATHLCEYCTDRELCADCECHVDPEDGVTVYRYGGERRVCQSCAEDYNYCEDCGRYVYVEEGQYLDRFDRWVCDDCLEAEYVCCDECGEFHHREETFTAYKGGNTWRNEVTVCEDCFYEHYTQCEHCGDDFHNDDIQTVTNEDDDEICVCAVCAQYYKHAETENGDNDK